MLFITIGSIVFALSTTGLVVVLASRYGESIRQESRNANDVLSDEIDALKNRMKKLEIGNANF